MAKDKKTKAKDPAGKKTRTAGLLLSLVMGLGAVIFLPTTMVIAIGIIPTFVALFVDNSQEKLMGVTIGAMNIAGIIPGIITLWQKGHTVAHALDVIASPIQLLFMYGAAGVGFLVYVNVPTLLRSLNRKRGNERLKNIKQKQDEMIEEWGDQIIGKPIESDAGDAV